MKRYQFFLSRLIVLLFLLSYRYLKETEIPVEGVLLIQSNDTHVLQPATNTAPVKQVTNTSPIKQVTSSLPNAIIHVGPHKTGSTAIQATLDLKDKILQHDNYALPSDADVPGPYVGRKRMANLPMYVYNSSLVNLAEFGPTFQAFLKRSQNEKKNIIISAEGLDTNDPFYLNTIIGPGFHTRIIIMYRRYFEWIVSSYHGRYKTVRDYNSPFPDIETFLADTSKAECDSRKTYDSYKRVFDDIIMLNYNSEKSIMESFFCDGVIGAEHTCQNVIENETNEQHANPAGNTEGQRVINEALKNNILPSDRIDEVLQNIGDSQTIDEQIGALEESYYSKLDQVASRVNEELLKENNPLTSCVKDDVLEQMYQKTLEEEKLLLPEWFEEKKLQESFDEFCQNRLKLCYMNVTAVFQDPVWTEFLRRIWY